METANQSKQKIKNKALNINSCLECKTNLKSECKNYNTNYTIFKDELTCGYRECPLNGEPGDARPCGRRKPSSQGGLYEETPNPHKQNKNCNPTQSKMNYPKTTAADIWAQPKPINRHTDKRGRRNPNSIIEAKERRRVNRRVCRTKKRQSKLGAPHPKPETDPYNRTNTRRDH